MKIILVRHGETDENVAHRYLGHTDAKLNENGREQLRFFTKKLKEIEPQTITSIYSSDLSRALESAHIIGEAFQLIPISEFSLRELNFGDWECKTYDDLFSQENERLQEWIQDPLCVAPPNGETLTQLGKRIDDWVEQRISNKVPNETIMMVSHGGPIRWFLSKWVKGDLNDFWQVDGAKHGNGLIVEFNEQTELFTLISTIN